MSNVAIPSDRQTEVAGHRHHESFEVSAVNSLVGNDQYSMIIQKLALSHRLLADFNASMCRLRQGDGNDGGCRAVSPIVSPTGERVKFLVTLIVPPVSHWGYKHDDGR
jgi:hypothetical protein